MKNLIIAIITLCFFASCEKDVNVVIPYEGEKLVLNSLFYADSNIYARVLKSQKLSSNYFNAEPSNAVLTLLENNIPVGNFTTVNIFNTKWYKSPIVAQVGKTYKIITTAPGFNTVEGEDVVPQKPTAEINSIAVIQNNNSNGINYNRKLKFKIKDAATDENYYLIKVHGVDTNLSANGPRYNYNIGRYGLYAELEGYSTDANTFGGSFGNNEIFLTDETFNGREVSFNLNFESYSNNSHFALEVVSLSKSTFRYLKSVQSQQNTQGDPFAEATIVFNNIKNGFGIVGGAAEKIIFIRKP
jgi:hypothetical protein